MRALLNKAFTPRVVAAMGPAIAELVDAHLDRVQPQGHMDVIRDLAFPLPVIVLARMLGVPRRTASNSSSGRPRSSPSNPPPGPPPT